MGRVWPVRLASGLLLLLAVGALLQLALHLQQRQVGLQQSLQVLQEAALTTQADTERGRQQQLYVNQIVQKQIGHILDFLEISSVNRQSGPDPVLEINSNTSVAPTTTMTYTNTSFPTTITTTTTTITTTTTTERTEYSALSLDSDYDESARDFFGDGELIRLVFFYLL